MRSLSTSQPGLIPAYAGSTVAVRVSSIPPRAHPRLRGEHGGSGDDGDDAGGSSPLTRGARKFPPPRHAFSRLIPAYAGSTHQRACLNVGNEAHPRLRGEHWVARARALLPYAVPHRLIPAYAGSTCKPPVKLEWPRAHPRLRGEHPHPRTRCYLQTGSSPLTRGARVSGGVWRDIWWLIPAYAGSTGPAGLQSSAEAAHPRLRGEHSCAPLMPSS